MSNIYIQEPPTSGKVLLTTTVGDIDIELWTKETPKACRNFIQLCLEGYYNNLTFHRVVKRFIVQGGDPTGTGEGGASIYGKPFRDEFHSRLRFNRRGLVAMANAGPNDNGSQFFFTLDATPELDKKHTLFGKVNGPTVYNMIKLGDVDTDENERPRYPMKILRTKVLHNPFSDIVPRDIKTLEENARHEKKISKSKATKNFKLLSFGEEAEEDEEEVLEMSKVMKGKSKSSHDLTDDPRLSSVPAVKQLKQKQGEKEKENVEESSSSSEDSEDSEKERVTENVKKKLKKDNSKEEPPAPPAPVPPPSKQDMEKSSIEELRKQARQLKREIMGSAKKEEEEVEEEEKEVEPADESMAEYMEMREKYAMEKKAQPKKGSAREEQTLALLAKFKAKLHSASEDASEQPMETDKEKDKKEEGEQSDEDEDVDLSGTAWLAHQLHFDESSSRVLDANITDVNRYEIFDPRNPINKRKRESGKSSSRDKRR